VKRRANGATVQARDAEAYRMLRTRLRYTDIDHPPKTLVVTSAIPGEGKTLTAINLAITFAQTDERVLLIEADLRWPGLTAYLDIDTNTGLSDVLAGHSNFWDAIITHKVDDHQLEVLPSGPLPPNPSELLQSTVMVELLASLREVYDVIVIDTPAVLRVTDAALVAAEADGVILLVRLGETSRDQLYEAASRLRAVEAPLMGTVLHTSLTGDSIEYDA
jgi:capsular exopolysaccharide synthesis family protein